MKKSFLVVAFLFVISIIIVGCADRTSHILHAETFDVLNGWIGIGIFFLVILNLSFSIWQTNVKDDKSEINKVVGTLVGAIVGSFFMFTILGLWMYKLNLWMLSWMGETAMTILWAISGLFSGANIVTYVLFGYAFEDEIFLRMVAWQTGVAVASSLVVGLIWLKNLAKEKRSGKVRDSFVEGTTDIAKLQNDVLFNVLVQIAYADNVLKKEEKEFLTRVLKKFEFISYSINVEDSLKLAKEKPLKIEGLESIFTTQAEKFELVKFCLMVASIDSEVAPAEVELIKQIQTTLKVTDSEMQKLIDELSQSK